MGTLTPQLSSVTSDEYRLWKAETLAKQNGQIEPSQKTGLWTGKRVCLKFECNLICIGFLTGS